MKTLEQENKQNKKLSIEDKLFLVKNKKDKISHITINKKICKKCQHKACLIVCPAKSYEENHGTIEVAYENCLECGSCRVICTDGAIKWENPRGGFGVRFKNG
ncbi:MAG: 4Fe-4S dicluster domain-containing protein [Candidatus Omnitrophica bacterium]|nr:4Fe-4S dicluster domain-containing protein [Candidatus Omnitrophota bacterium]